MKNPIYILLYISMIAFAATLAGCSESEELSTADAAGKALRFEVGPYPAFAEGAQTRTVGTFDAGKTSWEAGDELLVMISTYSGASKLPSYQHFVLTYDGETWSADKDVVYQYYGTITVHAIYSPGLEFAEGEHTPVLKEGAIPGTFELINKIYTISQPDGVIPIDFSNVKRSNSRLRMAGEPGMTIKVYTTGFLPNGASSAPESYTLTTDEKGNAYLYGYWPGGATIKIVTEDGKLTLFEKTLEEDFDDNCSYVANITPTYKSDGDGTADNPYKICLPQQLASLADAVNGGELDGVEGGIHVALESDLDLSDYPDWTPIGSTTHPFTGSFDGQGHTISGLTINNNNPNDVKEWGLFGMVQDATIKNVRVDSNITLRNFGDGDEGAEENFDGIGGIAGRSSGKENNFYGCHSNVTIEGTGNSCWAGVGGIVGFVKEGKTTFVACGSTGKVTMESQTTEQIKVGGLIGALRMTDYFTVHACYCNAEIHSIYNGEEKGTGALFGKVGYGVSGRLIDYILIDAFY